MNDDNGAGGVKPTGAAFFVLVSGCGAYSMVMKPLIFSSLLFGLCLSAQAQERAASLPYGSAAPSSSVDKTIYPDTLVCRNMDAVHSDDKQPGYMMFHLMYAGGYKGVINGDLVIYGYSGGNTTLAFKRGSGDFAGINGFDPLTNNCKGKSIQTLIGDGQAGWMATQLPENYYQFYKLPLPPKQN